MVPDSSTGRALYRLNRIRRGKIKILSRTEIFRCPLPFNQIAFKTAMMKLNLFLTPQLFNCMTLKYIVHRPPSSTSELP